MKTLATRHRFTPWGQNTILSVMVALCVLPEVILLVAGLEYFSNPRLRPLVYEYAGFWPGLLRDWTPNYAAQPYVMFVSYSFLHGGVMHLIVNMLTLWSLGQGVVDRVGQRGFCMLYVGSTIGGAVGFALLAPGLVPMVGASGALFGLVGGLLAWMYVDHFNLESSLWPVLQIAIALVVLNALMWWVMDGQLAWETHLGGFVSGWIVALLVDPRAR